jgi:hypothetical protein
MPAGGRALGAFLLLAGCLFLFGGILSGGWNQFLALALLPLWACLIGAGGFLLLRPKKASAAEPAGSDPWAYDPELDGPDAEDR